MTAELSCRVIEAEGAAPTRSALVVHGIMGSKRNWAAFSRRFVAMNKDWRFVLVDLRNHGESQGFDSPNTLAACRDDLARLEAEQGAFDALIGHSFGGKVVLSFATLCQRPQAQVFVLDCPLSESAELNSEGSEVGRVLDVLAQAPSEFERRSDGQKLFATAGFSPSLAGWMATNLVARGESFTWHFCVSALQEMIRDYWSWDAWAALPSILDRGIHVEVVRALSSDRWSESEINKLAAAYESGSIAYTELPDAGHWLHIDNPEGLIQILAKGLS